MHNSEFRMRYAEFRRQNAEKTIYKNMTNTKIKQFKHDFKKRCFDFSLLVIKLESKLNLNRSNRIIFEQLLRSAMSIGANVVEGGNSVSNKEFINYFNIALKSSSETLYWLALIKATNLSLDNEIQKLINECEEIRKILSTIVLNAKDKTN